jgi:hypothetical protein
MTTTHDSNDNINFAAIVRIRRLEEVLDRLNMQIGPTKHSSQIAIYPQSDQMPAYSQDTALFCGTLAEIECFAAGWHQCLTYLRVIGAARPERIEKCEQKIREDKLARALKGA